MLSVLVSFGLLVGLIVFFFKQKTAYDMRISDWSSDVCSSDLFAPDRHRRRRGVDDRARRRDHEPEGNGMNAANQDGRRRSRVDAKEIVRASCRERVCQYV